jgi:hypothetical protein
VYQLSPDPIIPDPVQSGSGSLYDDFSDTVAAGEVIGSRSADGQRRGGIDVEGVMVLRDGALRLQPLATPGWQRVGVAYGPFARRNGLAMA